MHVREWPWKMIVSSRTNGMFKTFRPVDLLDGFMAPSDLFFDFPVVVALLQGGPRLHPPV
jgi:hypothetical protein